MDDFLRPALLPFVAGLAALIFLLAIRRFADAPDRARHHWLLLFGIVIVPGTPMWPAAGFAPQTQPFSSSIFS